MAEKEDNSDFIIADNNFNKKEKNKHANLKNPNDLEVEFLMTPNFNYEEEQFYLNHVEKINKLEKAEKIAQIFMTIFIILFLVLMAIKVHQYDMSLQIQQRSKFSFFIPLIPALLTILSATIWANIHLKLKNYSETINKINYETAKNSHCTFGDFIYYFSLNFLSICCILYLTFLTLKLESVPQFKDVEFSILAIPFYVGILIIFLYYLFLFPALLLVKEYTNLIVIASYIISSLIFILILNNKLDGRNEKAYYISIFIPLFIALIIHIIGEFISLFATKDEIIEKENTRYYIIHLYKLLSIISILTSAVLISCKIDQFVYTPNVILIFILFVGFLFQIDNGLLCSQNEELEKAK